MATNKNKKKLRAPKVADSELSRIVTDIYDELNKLASGPSEAATQNIRVTSVTQSQLPANPEFNNVLVDTLGFNTTYSPTGDESQGTFYWNSDDETVSLVTNGSVLDLGHALEIHVKVTDTDGVVKGDVVGATGAVGSSGKIEVQKFTAGTSPTRTIVGIMAEDVAVGEFGKAVAFGKIRKIDTNTPAWDEGTILYAGSDGALTSTEPGEGNVKLPIAFVVTRHQNTGELFVRITPIDENIDADKLDGQHGSYYLDYTNFTNTPTDRYVNSLNFDSSDFTVDIQYNDSSPSIEGLSWAHTHSQYLTAEVNDLTSAVTWANVPDANITSSSVTQHIVIGDPQPANGGGALAFTNGEFIFTPASVPDVSGFITAVNTSVTSGLSGGASSGDVSLTLDASALTADTTLASTDVFIIGQTGATKKIAASNIDLSLLDNSASLFISDYTVTQADVTQHQAALSITESQITDLQSYLTAHPTIVNNVTNQNNSGNSFIQDLTFDINGHVTAVASATASFTDTNYYLNGANWATGTGVLTLNVQGADDITVDLDGRYLTALPSHNHDDLYYTETEVNTLLSQKDNYGSWTLKDNASPDNNQKSITSGTTVQFVGSGATTVTYNTSNDIVTINSTDNNTDTNWYPTNAETSVSSGVITLGGVGMTDVTIDLSSEFLSSLPTHNHDSLYYTQSQVDTLLGNKDDYDHWSISDGSNTGDISSGNFVTFVGTNDASVTYNNSLKTVTIDVQTPAGSNYYLNSITGNGNSSALQFDFAGDPNDIASFTHDFSHNHNDLYYTKTEINNAGYLTSVPAEYLTQTEGDARYLQLSGGTLTGTLTVQAVVAQSNAQPKYQLIETDTTDENKEILVSGGDFFIRNLDDNGTVPANENILKISHEGAVTLLAQGSTTATNLNALFQDTSGNLKRRTLGSLAYSSATYDNYGSWTIADDGSATTTQIGSGNTLNIVGGTGINAVLTSSNTLTISSTITDTDTNTFLSSAIFNTGDGVLTLTKNDSSTVTADLDGRYLELLGGTLTGNLVIFKDKPHIELKDNATNDPVSGTIDFLESGNSWGTTGSYGMRIQYDGDANRFEISGMSNGTEYQHTTISRDAGNYVTSGTMTAASFTKASNSGGFLKADGTEDTSTYLTSYTETDPVFSASAASGITSGDIANWNTAYNNGLAGVSFDTSTGILSVSGQTGAYTADLDGRYLTSFDITSQTDPKYLRSNANDTTTGNITISKDNPTLTLVETNTATGSYPRINFDTGNNQGVSLYHNEFDGELSENGYGLVLDASPSNTQFPTTGTLSFSVLGEMYTGGTTLTSLNRVFHDGYHPNADALTDSRTISLSNNASGSVSFNGSSDVSISTSLVPITIDSNDNANSLSDGIYGFTNDAPSNIPDDYGMLFQFTENREQQLLQTYGGSANKVSLYGRRKTGGTWDTSWTQYFSDHYHPNADKLTTAREITLGGDLTGSAFFDGSSDITISAQVSNNSHTHDDRYLQLTGGTLTGALTINGGINNVWSYSTATTDQPGFVAANNVDYSSQTSLLYAKIYGSGITANAFGVTLGNYGVVATDGSANNGLLLGTFNAKPLIIGTNATERLRIDSSGNVGIGTTSPDAKLHISSNSQEPASTAIQGESKLVISGTDGNMDLLSRDDNSTVANSIGLGRYNITNGSLIHKFGIVHWSNTGSQGSNTGDRLAFSYGTNKDAWGNSELLTIKSNGNVGIGTTNPLYPFSLESTTSGLISRIYNTNTNGQGLLIRAGATSLATRVLQVASSNDTKIMTVNSNGNVGIGTTSPEEDLHIEAASGGVLRLTDTAATAGGTIGKIQAATTAGTFFAGINFFLHDSDDGEIRFRQKVANTNTDTMTLVDGNVGIGTASPSNPLHISANSTNTAVSYFNNTDTANGNGIFVRGGGSNAGKYIASFQDAAANTRMHILANGNVGINTTNPLSKLHVEGPTGVYSTIGAADNVRTGLAHYDTTAQAANIGGQLVLGYKYTDAGVYTEGAIIKMYKENSTSGQYGSGLKFQVRNHGVALSTKMILDPSGNVGINTTNPSSSFKLDVNGAGRFVNDLYADEDLVVANNLYINTTGYSLSQTNNAIRVTTPSGYVVVGPQNTGFSHINTDRPSFYFNKNIIVDEGIVQSYDEDLQLRRAQSNTDQIVIKDNQIDFDLAGSTQAKIEPNGKLSLISSTITRPSINSGALGTEVLNIESGDLNINSSHIYLNNATDVDGDFYCNSELGGGTLAIDGNASIDYSLLGRGFRQANRGELHLNSTGTNDVSEIFLGYGNGFTEANIRWGISDRGTSTGKLEFYRGPALGGFSSVMTLDGLNKRLGIGTSSPTTKLHLTDTSSAFQFTADTGTAGDGRLNIGHFPNGTFIGTYGDDGGAADVLRFGTHSGDERMRIDSSGNLLVGKTTADFGATQGVELRSTGNSYFTGDGANALRLNRLSSDGDLLTFRKDGTTVGSIGSASGGIYFGSGNSGTERMRIDSSGRQLLSSALSYNFIGNNTSDGSDNERLFLGGGGDASSGRGAVIALYGNEYSGSTGLLTFIAGTASGYINFMTGSTTTERMRIDSSGNVLIGKTATALATVGTTLFDDGTAYHTVNGNVTMRLNRLTSDGTIIDFRKDTTTVGSIGSQGGDSLNIGSGDTGLLFSFANDAIHAWNTSTNSSRDNAIDLGRSSQRFKDLYLGGSVYLGGTTSANALGDYEEGSWTPAFSPQDDIIDTVTYDSVRFGRYTKIGDTVHVWGRIKTDVLTFVDNIGALNINGLPFTPATILSSGTSTFAGTIGYATAWGGDDPWFITAESGVDKIELWYKTSFSGNLLAVQTTDAGSGANSNDLIFQITYKV